MKLAGTSQSVVGSRVLIIGNAGSGKTYLARTLSERLGLPGYSLDDWFWADAQFSAKRPIDELHAIIEAQAQTPQWIVEGVYGELAVRLLDRAEALFWIDVDWKVCRESLQLRWAAVTERSPALIESFDRLMAYAEAYWTRTDGRSHTGHREIFDAFGGRTWRFSSRNEVNNFLAQGVPRLAG